LSHFWVINFFYACTSWLKKLLRQLIALFVGHLVVDLVWNGNYSAEAFLSLDQHLVPISGTTRDDRQGLDSIKKDSGAGCSFTLGYTPEYYQSLTLGQYLFAIPLSEFLGYVS